MLGNRIDRLIVKNYRSLGDVEVDLSDLMVLVGPNGSGKSNFLDVLRFLGDALRRGLDAALICLLKQNKTRSLIIHYRCYMQKLSPSLYY